MQILFEDRKSELKDSYLITEDAILNNRDILEAQLKKKGIKITKVEKTEDDLIIHIKNENSKLLLG
jgi:hypothetical protein